MNEQSAQGEIEIQELGDEELAVSVGGAGIAAGDVVLKPAYPILPRPEVINPAVLRPGVVASTVMCPW